MRPARVYNALLGGVVSSWPLAVRAQAMPVIGFLNVASPAGYANYVCRVPRRPEGGRLCRGARTVTIEYRWAEGHYDRLPEMAAELVRRQVSVIVTPTHLPIWLQEESDRPRSLLCSPPPAIRFK